MFKAVKIITVGGLALQHAQVTFLSHDLRHGSPWSSLEVSAILRRRTYLDKISSLDRSRPGRGL